MAKRKILGLNSARLYSLSPDADVSNDGRYRPVPRDYDTRVPPALKTLLEFPGFTATLWPRRERSIRLRGRTRATRALVGRQERLVMLRGSGVWWPPWSRTRHQRIMRKQLRTLIVPH